MVSHTGEGGVGEALHYLAANRTSVYIGGLLVISAPIALANVGVEVSAPVRTALVVASLAVMIATYVGERRTRGEVEEAHKAAAAGDRREYSTRTRLAVGLAVVGLAVGIYVGLQVSPLAGLAFGLGAYFFAYLAFRGGTDG